MNTLDFFCAGAGSISLGWAYFLGSIMETVGRLVTVGTRNLVRFYIATHYMNIEYIYNIGGISEIGAQIMVPWLKLLTFCILAKV